MAELPALTARQVIKVLSRIGFLRLRQKGSHLVLINPKTKVRTVVPVHSGKTIKKPLLRAIIRDAGLTDQGFKKLL